MSIFKKKPYRNISKSEVTQEYSCTIRFLDDSEPIQVKFTKETKGQFLIDHVCKELNLLENDYFGLRYVDSEKQRHWLDPIKPVYKQLKSVVPVVLCFRVKFYPADPMNLKEEITRYFLFLQLRRDLHHGRLLCLPQDGNLLASFIIQSEVGDYDPQDHPAGYVSEFKMLPKQTNKHEDRIAELHKNLVGQVPSEAESNFLKKACQLDTYGVDPHAVKAAYYAVHKLGGIYKLISCASSQQPNDQKGNQMYLGVTHLGVVTFQGNKRTHLFKWSNINRIAFEGKMFIIHITMSEADEPSNKRGGTTNSNLFGCASKNSKKHTVGFKCPSHSACKHLWKCTVEQQAFFTLVNSSDAPKVSSGAGLFRRGSKYRFSGRCYREVCHDSATIRRSAPSFTRSTSNPQFARHSKSSTLNSLQSTSRDSNPDVIIENSALEDTDVEKKLKKSLVETTAIETPAIPEEEPETALKEVVPSETAAAEAVEPVKEEKNEEEKEEGKEEEEEVAAESALDKESVSQVEAPPKTDAEKLDVEIKNAARELEEARKVNSHQFGNHLDNNHMYTREMPVDIGFLKENGSAPNKAVSNCSSGGGQSPVGVSAEEAAHPLPGPMDKQQNKHNTAKSHAAAAAAAPSSALKLLALSSFFILFIFTLAFILVCETEVQVPVLKDIRGFPETQKFIQKTYAPFRSSVAAIFKR